MQAEQQFVQTIRLLLGLVIIIVSLLAGASGYFVFFSLQGSQPESQAAAIKKDRPPAEIWQAPDSTLIALSPNADLIAYGKFSETQHKYGPFAAIVAAKKKSDQVTADRTMKN